ncbi:MAG: TolC family protein [Magnetococcales bacterium]|nr:TolC family protein [Magnetococcales bacterium]
MRKKDMFKLLLLICALLLPAPSRAAESHASHPVGASVEELLALASRMNPELAAAALDNAAAQARVEGADTLPDPKFQVTFDEISKNDAGWPSRTGTYKYTLSQEIPGWGKRQTRREIAEAGSREAAGVLEERVAEVVMRVKTTYADYHRVHLSMDQTRELIQVMRALVEFARVRYAQGMGGQAEATSAEAERGALAVELSRLEKERHRIRARMNTLVNRPPDAPVVEHPRLRPLPGDGVLNSEKLLERALVNNPGLKSSQARLEGADGEKRLADKTWLPDLELGFGVVNRREEGARDGFEAMVNFNLPVRGEWRSAQIREAQFKKQAARERLVSTRLQLESTLRESLLSLEEARLVEKSTVEILLPQARIALQSALKGYESGINEAATVLDAVQRLKKFQIERVKAQFDQQVRLAELERLIGGDL